MNTSHDGSSMSADSFADAFRYLSHHIFPDGCPEPSLGSVWPRGSPDEKRDGRSDGPTVTSSGLALESLNSLQKYAQDNGLCKEQLSAVACVCHKMATATDLASVLVKNVRHFRTAIKCLLPSEPHSITRNVVIRLLSVHHTTKERTIVLRFLTLAVQTGEWLDVDALKALTGSYLYATVFQSALQPASCSDAVRLLLCLTCAKHATKHRLRRLELVKKLHGDAVKPISALIILMHVLRDVTAKYLTTVDDLAISDDTDKDWERDFARNVSQEPPTKKLPLALLSTRSKPLAYSRRLADLLSDRQIQQSILISESERDRYGAVLSSCLAGEWFGGSTCGQTEANTTQARVALLSALSVFVKRTDWIPPEVDRFVTQIVLSNWDGTEKPIGDILCIGLLPYTNPPASFRLFRDGVLHFLNPHFLYGSSSQQALVMAALMSMLDRWLALATSASCNIEEATISAHVHQEPLSGMVSSFVDYLESLLLKSFLSRGGNEFLRMMTVDFYELVSGNYGKFEVVTWCPSSALCYRLLQAPSALSVDRLCQLLISMIKGFRTDNFVGAITQDRQAHSPAMALDVLIWHIYSSLRPSSLPTLTSSEEQIALIFKVSSKSRSALPDAVGEAIRALHLDSGIAFGGYVIDFLQAPKRSGMTRRVNGDACHNDDLNYLDYLKQRGFSGTHLLLLTCVDLLRRLGEKQSEVTHSQENN